MPYYCRFHVYARSDWFARVSNNDSSSTGTGNKKTAANNPAHIRILCLTDPARVVNPLELQEDFTEIERSEVVEIRDRYLFLK